MQFKAVLFDLDGTLLDTSALILQAFQYAMRQHCNREVEADFIRAHFGMPLQVTLKLLVPDAVDEIVKTYHEHMAQHIDTLTKSFDGMAENIHLLYNHGIRMAVVTSKMHPVALHSLRLGGLDKYFSPVVGFEQTPRHKPHPDPAAFAVKALGLKPAECLMVGDSAFDIICGREAGCKTAAVRWTEVPWQVVTDAKPDYIINSPAELPLITTFQ